MTIENLRVSPGIVTADVDGERVVLAAPPIAPGIWVSVDVGASNLAQTLEHTWEEHLWPETLTTEGSVDAVHSVRRALETDRRRLLLWRGYGSATSGEDEWVGAALPELPTPARRPPSSVPKRFGSSGLQAAGDDLAVALAGVYDAF